MNRPPNEQTVYKAGPIGWPSPKGAPSHNYSVGEMQAWTAGMDYRYVQQFKQMADTG